jgi:hypothetical protein
MRFLIAAIAVTSFWLENSHSANYLPSNSYLQNDQYIISSNGSYLLIMQADGSLVMYRRDGSIRYRMKKHGRYAYMSGDGNFQQLSSGWQVMWQTRTAGHPGATLAIQDDGNLVVYSTTGVPLWNIGAERSDAGILASGDVIGRELNVWGLGSIGHVGIWDGTQVIEAGPSGESGNAIHLTSFGDFKLASSYWGKATPSVADGLVGFCAEPFCSIKSWSNNMSARKAIATRAYLIHMIGADYTISTQYQRAWPASELWPAQRGVYRCDTFTYDALTHSATYIYELNYPQKQWKDFLAKVYSDGITPKSLFEKVRGFK